MAMGLGEGDLEWAEGDQINQIKKLEGINASTVDKEVIGKGFVQDLYNAIGVEDKDTFLLTVLLLKIWPESQLLMSTDQNKKKTLKSQKKSYIWQNI